jgi:cation diffusion facilitator CzcD-associated flavoprotein CzcO
MRCQLLLSSVATLLSFAAAAPATFPVCIVGAGPAGLIAASKLESQGRKVVLFEKQAAVGGKSQAVYEK